MLLPIDDSVLKENPRFANLYKTLTTEILNPDCSTKDDLDPTAGQRNAVREELKAYRLKAYRLKAARLGLLRDAISTATSDLSPVEEAPARPRQQQQQQSKLQQPQQHRRSNSRSQSQSQIQQQSTSTSTSTTGTSQQTPTPALPPELIQLLLLIPPFLNNASTLPPPSLALLLSSPPFSDMEKHFPQLLSLVSLRLTSQAKTLARVINPSTNASYIHRTIHTLAPTATSLAESYAKTKTQLSQARLATLASWTRHEEKHNNLLSLLLGSLELKHGAASTSAELRAVEAAQEAQFWALASESLLWDTRQLTYPPEARQALANYRQHLRDAGRRLEDGARVREAELADYGVDVDSNGTNNNNNSNSNNDNISKHDRRASLDALGVNRLHRRQGSRAAPVVDENKERTMREMARVWREMETRLREIQADLNRLR